jgi:hypothetical protein
MMITEEEFERRKAKFAEELDALRDRMCSEELGVGSVEAVRLLGQLFSTAQKTLTNTLTVEGLVDTWIDNIHANSDLCMWVDHECEGEWCRLKRKVERKLESKAAIVIGAGPSLTNEQIYDVYGFNGLIICTNKSLTRLVNHGVRPDICVVLDASEDVLKSFDFGADFQYSDINFLIATQVHPEVMKRINNLATDSNLHYFHASIPDEYMPNVNYMLEKFWKLPVVDTGGNAGILAIQMAEKLGAKNIGMLGMEHSHRLDPRWTNEQAFTYSTVYAPEDNQTFAVTPSFQGYINTIVQWAKLHNDINLINLTDFGWFYVMRKRTPIPYMDRKEFVNKYANE